MLKGLSGQFTTPEGIELPAAFTRVLRLYAWFDEKKADIVLAIYANEAAYDSGKPYLGLTSANQVTLTGAEFDTFFSDTALDSAGNRTAMYQALKANPALFCYGWADVIV